MDVKLPKFARVMFFDSGFQTKFPLPLCISKKLVEQEVEEVLLTSPKGSWEVQIHGCGGKLWLTKGWDDFVLQHGIADREIVEFQHTSDLSFEVTIFGLTGCERGFHGESKSNNMRGITQGKNAEDISHVYVKLEVDRDEVPSPVEIQKRDRAHDKGDTKRKRKPKVVNVSSTEQHLQFVTTMKQYNIRRRSPFMHIPADFCVANGLYHDARISLKGPSDEQQVSLKVCRGGRTRYAVITRGWSEFIASNDLKEGDTCTFKLHSTGSSSNAVVFDVKVLRKET